MIDPADIIERCGTTYIVTYVTDAGDHYHEVVDNFDEFIAKTQEEGMEDYYQQVHVFRIDAPLMCTYTLYEHPCWEPGVEIP